MSKWLLAGALVLACGGESAQFSDDPGQQVAAGAGGSEDAGGTDSDPQAGHTQSVGGTGEAGGAATAGTGGTPEGGEAGSVSGQPHSAGASTAGTSSAGSAGAGGAGGSAGHGTGGSGAGTAGSVAGQGGKGWAGAGGSSGSAAVCSDDDSMDCNGIPNDGTNQTNPDSCEAWKGDHDTCGSCDKKCGVTQVCKTSGAPGAWTYFCASK